MFSSVPVVDVTSDNASSVLPTLRAAVLGASFVAVDCELSGLGDRRQLNASSIEDRFENIGRVAKTRAIIAIGLSCFKRRDSGDNKLIDSYSVQTFNLVTLCSEDYIVEPGALKFLVEHGFDFQRQYSKGIQYKRGADPDDDSCALRSLMSALVTAPCPLVVHNGLVDLVFLYHNLYAPLPRTLSAFIADLTQMFPAGVYDTKYLADYVERTRASYLTYLFRKQQRTNHERAKRGRRHLDLSFQKYPAEWDFVGHRDCALRLKSAEDDGDAIKVCDSYADHGHCVLGSNCMASHDVDLILDRKEGWGRNRSNEEEEEPAVKKSKVSPPSLFGGGHRAGFDAFMTAFVFAAHLSFRDKPAGADFASPHALDMSEHANKVYLVSKDFPLLVRRSQFAKNSAGHHEKFSKISGTKEEVNGKGC